MAGRVQKAEVLTSGWPPGADVEVIAADRKEALAPGPDSEPVTKATADQFGQVYVCSSAIKAGAPYFMFAVVDGQPRQLRATGRRPTLKRAPARS